MIQVLIVDDDAMVIELNLSFLGRLPGFSCSACASTLEQAKNFINNSENKIDLVLLDIYMRLDSGLDFLADIRNSKRDIDVIMVTSAMDSASVQTAMHYGVADYLIKPFQFSRFEQSMMTWREKRMLIDSNKNLVQCDVDRIIHGSKSASIHTRNIPKGITLQTLRTICKWIDINHDINFSTAQISISLNISSVSCRKYLIWLAQIHALETTILYGSSGRPVYRYQIIESNREIIKYYAG